MEGLTSRGRALDDITAELFAVNGRFLRAGDVVAAHVGLTSSRWQVMGLLLDGPATVAQLARERGLRRQAVQQTVTRLDAEGMVATGPNPHDRRAPLVRLTEQGRGLLQELLPIQQTWIEGLADAIPAEDLRTTLDVLHTLRHRLDEQLRPAAG